MRAVNLPLVLLRGLVMKAVDGRGYTSNMRISFKIALGFAARIALFLLLSTLLPDYPGIASIPGALFVGYVAKLTWERSKKDGTNTQ